MVSVKALSISLVYPFVVLFRFAVSQIVFLVLVLSGLVIWVLNWILRTGLSLYLRYRYGGSVKLVADSGDAMFGYTSPGNTRNMLVTIEVEQRVTVDSCLQALEKNVLEYVGKDNSRPFHKLKWIFDRDAYPYFSWRLDEHFSVNNHFRVVGDIDKVWKRDDLHQLLSDLTKDMGEDHPQWEFLLIRRFLHNTSSQSSFNGGTETRPLEISVGGDEEPQTDNSERCCIIARVHHAYFDGLSFINLVSHAIGTLATTANAPTLSPKFLSTTPTHELVSEINRLKSGDGGESEAVLEAGMKDTSFKATTGDKGNQMEETETQLPRQACQPDPSTYPYALNPVVFSIPFKYRLIYNLNCILFGGYHLLKTVSSRDEHLLNLHCPYPGDDKFYDTCEDISNDVLRTIRSVCKASMANIIATCFLAALEKVVPSRLPKCGKIGHTLAILPYPDETFHNRFTMMSVPFKRSDGPSRVEKVKEYQKRSSEAIRGPEYYLYYWFFQFWGQLPSSLFKWVLRTPRFTFFLNNVPFAKRKILVMNSLVHRVSGWPPHTTDAGLGVTLIGYAEKLSLGATADSSWLTKDQLRLVVQEFEREIKLLAQECAQLQP